MKEDTQYRLLGAAGGDGTPAWSNPAVRPPLTGHPARAALRPGMDDDREQMALFGIEAADKTVYTYKGYVYDRLADALAYARIDKAREARRGEDAPAGDRR